MNDTRLGHAIDDYRSATPGSRALFERARSHLPGGSTRSASFFEPYPLYLQRGAGTRVWDVDDAQRLDFDSNYTVLIHGQLYPPIVEAMTRQAQTMHCAAAPSPLEVALAEAIKQRLPSIDLIRFTTSGTEAAMIAMRAARAFTGRERIAKFVGGYHGSSEAAAISTPWLDGSEDVERIRPTPDGPGIPRAVSGTMVSLPFNDIDGVRRILDLHRDQVAAVIIEPVLGAGGLIPSAPDFLTALRELTAEHGALLIFDEVITFRLSYGGAQGLYGVTPDLTVLGKIIGGGLPVGALGGRRDVLSLFDLSRPGTIRHSGTYNANPMTAAAGLACLQALTPDAFAHLRTLGLDLAERCRRLLSDHRVPVSVTAIESLFNFQAIAQPAKQHSELLRHDRALLRTLHLGLLNAGVLITPSGMGCVSTAMTPDTVDGFVEGLRRTTRRYLS